MTVRWYVIRTKPRQEKQAEFHLGQLCVETFLPMLRQNKMVRRARKMVLTPLFPGYMFGCFDVSTQYRAVSYAKGVLTIVRFGGKPAEISQELIDAIKERLENVTPNSRHFKRGQILHINGGPLAGLEAVFVREMTDRNRVLLLLNTLGLHAKLNMSIDQVSLSQAFNYSGR